MSQNLWQQLLQKVEEEKPKTETIELVGTPQTVAQVLTPQPPNINVTPSVFVGEITVDEDDIDEEYVEDDFEEGVDIPVDNTFNITGLPTQSTPQINLLNETLITPIPQQKNQNTVNDIFALSGAPSEISSPKRGPGRPKGSTAKAVINQLPEKLDTVQEQSKSITDNKKLSPTTQQTPKEIALAIPKTTLFEIGESLSRIGAALISVSKS